MYQNTSGRGRQHVVSYERAKLGAHRDYKSRLRPVQVAHVREAQCQAGQD